MVTTRAPRSRAALRSAVSQLRAGFPALRLDLSVKRYADDLTLLFPDTQFAEAPHHAALDLRDHTLLVVDDVLYTGHSALKVVDWLARRRPAAPRGR